MENKRDTEHLWARCLEIIKCNVKEQEFETWFRPTQFISFDEETHELLLSVPSNFFYEILDGQFKKLMYNVAWRLYGKDVRIMYRILADSTNNIPIDVEGLPTQERMRKMKDDTMHPSSKAPEDDLDSNLNPDYRFENFIEGESNRFAYSIGRSIVDNPRQTTFNPLFIHGASGVGKTHLVNAIGLALKEKYPKRRVLYVSAHQFMVQFTESRRTNSFNSFIAFYQTIDTLIIDDIQELAGQEKTQEAFFHIFNHLKMNGKQIILTSDRSPAVMQGMEERLLTRFKWGLTAELERPELELRRRILLSKIRRDGLSIPDDVVDYVAVNASENVRDLEGIVNSLMAYSVVYNRNIDMPLAEQVVKRTIRSQEKSVTLDNIVDACCEHWNCSHDDLYSKSRKASIVTVRQSVMYLAHKHTKLTTSRIGLLIGGRNHATVLHAIHQVEDRLATDRDYKSHITAIEAQLKGHK